MSNILQSIQVLNVIQGHYVVLNSLTDIKVVLKVKLDTEFINLITQGRDK